MARHVAIQRAPIPQTLVYDTAQKLSYESPLAIESDFSRKCGENMEDDYLAKVHDLFERLIQTGLKLQQNKRYEDSASLILEYSDVVCIRGFNIYIKTREEDKVPRIELQSIVMRPCFQGYGMFTIVIYQLIRIALALHIKEVHMVECHSTMERIIRSKFKHHALLLPPTDDDEGLPTYVIANLASITPAFLRIETKLWTVEEAKQVRDLLPYDTSVYDLLVCLNPSAFPTAAQLNDQLAVDRHYMAFQQQHTGSKHASLTPIPIPSFTAEHSIPKPIFASASKTKLSRKPKTTSTPSKKPKTKSSAFSAVDSEDEEPIARQIPNYSRRQLPVTTKDDDDEKPLASQIKNYTRHQPPVTTKDSDDEEPLASQIKNYTRHQPPVTTKDSDDEEPLASQIKNYTRPPTDEPMMTKPPDEPMDDKWLLYTARIIQAEYHKTQPLQVQPLRLGNTIRLAFAMRPRSLEHMPNLCFVTMLSANTIRVDFCMSFIGNNQVTNQHKNIRFTYLDTVGHHIHFLNEDTGTKRDYGVSLELILHNEKLLPYNEREYSQHQSHFYKRL